MAACAGAVRRAGHSRVAWSRLALMVALAVDLPVRRRRRHRRCCSRCCMVTLTAAKCGDGRRPRIHGRLRARHGRLCICSALASRAADARSLAPVVRVAGAVCVAIGAGLRSGVIAMIPGEMFIKDGEIELNAGRKTRDAHGRQHRRPADSGRARTIISSKPIRRSTSIARRRAACGSNIAAGTAVRFEPGQSREVTLVALAGKRTVYGFRRRCMGKL